MKTKATLLVGVISCACLGLSGCSAMKTEISKRNLDVQTKMSDTIFLDPILPFENTVYVQIRNTTDKQDLNIKPELASELTKKGYEVTNNFKRAHYLLQANILKLSKSNLNESKGFLANGYGSAITGAAIAGSTMGSGTGIVGTSILGAAAGFVADALVEDTYYSMVTDLQISERTTANVTEHNKAKLHQGSSGNKIVTSDETTHWKRYQTRIVSTANQANLKFEDAEPALQKGLTQAIGGVF